jgi:DNA-binding GntR family transcriptional regulator
VATVSDVARRPLAINSAEDAVYEAIRDAILAGLPPGSPLRLARLAQEYGVSTMPIRTALRRLEGEGMVRQLPRRGATVAPLSIEDFEEIQALRAGIESLAAQRGAPRMTDTDVRAVRRALERLRALAADGRLADYVRLSKEVHDTCYRAAGNHRLIELVEEHRRPAERYVRSAVKASPNFKGSVERMAKFVSACEQRDGDLAAEAIRDGLQWTVRQVAALVPKLLTEDGTSGAAMNMGSQ